jgi:lipopolysaccharide cholinephosphotransferase
MGEDIKRVQNRLLDMAECIQSILDAHGIPHSMIWGTLLGAVRHHGFVPWDDDFDFCVFNEYYDEAIKWLREELPEYLFLEDEKSEPKYFHAWAHVKDLRTVAECDNYVQDNLYSHHGLSIDLYRMEKVKLNNLCERSEEEYIKYITRREHHGAIEPEELKLRYERWYDYTGYFWQWELENENLQSVEREVYSSLYTCRVYHEISDFFPLKKYKFEDREFWGPNDADAILVKCYWKYMELPPEEKRKGHYSYVEFLDDETV